MRDALAVFGEAIPNLTKASTTHGGEYAGRCPFPGCASRQDGFRCWPDRPRADGPLYWCRRCGRHGDLLQFVRDCYSYSYLEARDFLEMGFDDVLVERGRIPASVLASKWQATAYTFASTAYMRLWAEEGASALGYLTQKRGIPDSILREARVGCLNMTCYGEKEDWGTDSNVFIPRGIVIPLLYEQEVWGISIRRPDIDVELMADGIADRYRLLKGSKFCLYGAETIKADQPVVMVESYLDRLKLLDVSPYPVVATGSTSACHDERWLEKLATASVVLQAFDAEPSGDEGAQWWSTQLQNVVRHRPLAKDPGAQTVEETQAWLADAVQKVMMLTVQSSPDDLFAVEEEEIQVEAPTIKPSLRLPDDRRAFVLAEYECCICQGQKLSNSFLNVKSGHYCPWCFEAAPEFVSVPWQQVPEAGHPGRQRMAMFLLAWLFWPQVRTETCCYVCEERAVRYDLAGRLWCEEHAPLGAAVPGEVPDTILVSLEMEEAYDWEHCYVCGQEDVTIDDQARVYCAYHLLPITLEIGDFYPQLLQRAQELRLTYQVVPEAILAGPRCDRCPRFAPFVGQGGTNWCEVHKSGYELLEDGQVLGYPDLIYPGGSYLGERAIDGHISAGRTAWIQFAQEAPLLQVWAAKVYTWNVVCGRENRSFVEQVKRPPTNPCARYATIGCRGDGAGPYATMDRFGHTWCKDCHCAGELLDEGDEIGFPALGYGARPHDVFTKGGYRAYEDFVLREPSFVALEEARNVLRKKVSSKV